MEIEKQKEQEESKMTKIHRAISAKFLNHKYKLYNSYVFSWESDYFSTTTDNRYIYEVEVKLSRADFFADFKKSEKHQMLQNAFSFKTKNDVHAKTPNRIYYCCPEGMIKLEELPAYAGLLYIEKNGISVRQVKLAPFIHKEENVNKYLLKLIDKFYFQYEKMRSDYNWAKYQLKNHEFVVKENARLHSIANLDKNNLFMEEIDFQKSEVEKYKKIMNKYQMEAYKASAEHQKIYREFEAFKNKIEKEKEKENDSTK